MRNYTRTQNTNFKLFASDTMGIQANTTQTHRRMYTSTNSSEGEKGQWSYDIYLFRFKNLVLLLYISFIPWQAVKPRLFERITFSSLKCTQKLFEIANYQIYTCGFVKWLCMFHLILDLNVQWLIIMRKYMIGKSADI